MGVGGAGDSQYISARQLSITAWNRAAGDPLELANFDPPVIALFKVRDLLWVNYNVHCSTSNISKEPSGVYPYTVRLVPTV